MPVIESRFICANCQCEILPQGDGLACQCAFWSWIQTEDGEWTLAGISHPEPTEESSEPEAPEPYQGRLL